jgi:short-subunit dehydrogenase
VITGATSGIGLEHAKIMTSLGQNLILVSRNLEKLQNVKLDLEGRKRLID